MSPETSKQNLEPRERSVQDNLALMRRYFDLLFTQNMDQLLALIADDIEWRVIPTGDVFTNKDEFERLARNHWSASPDRTKKLVSLFASDEYACLEYITGGTLTGRADFQTISFEPTGRHYEFQCCFVFHLRDGKIDRVHEYFDLDTARRVTGQKN